MYLLNSIQIRAKYIFLPDKIKLLDWLKDHSVNILIVSSVPIEDKGICKKSPLVIIKIICKLGPRFNIYSSFSTGINYFILVMIFYGD